MDYTIMGTLDLLPIGIYGNDNSVANILSLNKVSNYYRVTMETKEYHVMLVHYSKYKA